MRWIVVVLALAAVLAAYFLWPASEPSTGISTQTEVAPAAASASQAEAASAASSGQAGAAAVEPDTAAEIARLEQEIQGLMAEFDRYRNDTERRDEIQAEIDARLAKYNELILPVALSEIKAGE